VNDEHNHFDPDDTNGDQRKWDRWHKGELKLDNTPAVPLSVKLALLGAVLLIAYLALT